MNTPSSMKGNHVCHITYTQPSNIHTLAHILGTSALIFTSCSHFSLLQPHHVTAYHPSPGDKPPEHRRAVRKDPGTKRKWQVKLNNLHMHLGSQLLPIFCAVSTVIPLLPKATFTPSIQPNLGLPRTRPPPTSSINTLLAIRYSLILSTYPNFSTLSDPLYSPTPFLFQLFYTPRNSKLYPMNRETTNKLLKHFLSRTITFFSQHFSYPTPLLRTAPLVQLLLRIYPQSSIAINRYPSKHCQSVSMCESAFQLA